VTATENAAHKLDKDALIAQAIKATGLSDFGDPDVHQPLSVLIPALNNEARLNHAGLIGQRTALLRSLINRLRIQDALKKHPEIRSEKIRGPIVIVGLPRSGTTKLQRMMAADPALQKLRMWQMMNPAPFPDARPGERDPRIAAAEQFVAQMKAQFPGFYAMHPIGAEDADEEVYLMQITFLSSLPMHGTRTPSYKRWMVAQDCAEWYGFLKLMLQFAQWQNGSSSRPWLLKAPWHFRWLRLLFDTFPDATVVHSYRDPLQTVASMCSLFEQNRMMSCDVDAPLDVGELVMDYWADAVDRFTRERELLQREERFIDVQYTDIVSDTLSVIRRAYARAGLPLTEEAIAAMQAWERDNPQHKHGKHEYSLQRYGISGASIRSRFGHYIRRFESPTA
jgi:Sulfotransferase family